MADPASLAAPARVSQSPLWQLLESYYQAQGPSAWEDQTPYFITNSTAAAEIYAELILAFVRDLGPNPQGRPLNVLELGTGLGRLGFLICRELERQREYFAATRAQPVRLILSDIPAQNVRFWKAHPALKQYCDKGWLDFACYNPLRDESLKLELSGDVIAPGSLELPLVVLANYVFDSLPHDEFLIRSHELLECRVELFRHPEPRHSEPDIRDVSAERTYHPFQPYPQAGWNQLLSEYREEFSDGAVTLPVGGLAVLERLQALSRRGLLLLSSDRGYTSPAAMAAHPRHDPDLHQGAFSFLVNFHALGRHFQDRGGISLCTSHGSSEGVQTLVGAVLADRPPLENLQFTFREHLDRVNRINAASLSLALLRQRSSSLEEARGLLAFLQLNLADPYAVTAALRRLSECAPSLRGADRVDLLELLQGAQESFYAFQGAVKLPHALGHLYFRLSAFDRAVGSFDRALAMTGEEASLHMFRAASLQQLGRVEEAQLGRARAIELDPSFADLELDAAV